jgi:hypothetical protein
MDKNITVDYEESQIIGHAVPATRQATPLALLEMAISKGVDTEQLSKLMDLQERWEDRLSKKAFNNALSGFLCEVPEIKKSGMVGYKTQKGELVGYTHAKLEDVAKAVNPLLGKFGLSYRWVQNQEGQNITVTCVVSHEDGYSEQTSLTATPDISGKKNPIQSLGSTLSYLMRYTVLSALGLTVSDDDDGAGSQGHEPTNPANPVQKESQTFNNLFIRATESAKTGLFNHEGAVKYITREMLPAVITQEQILQIMNIGAE